MDEKGRLYSLKLGVAGRERPVKIIREVYRTWQRLKRAYFNQRINEVVGDMRATWEVLAEVLGRGLKGSVGSACVYFRKGGVSAT